MKNKYLILSTVLLAGLVSAPMAKAAPEVTEHDTSTTATSKSADSKHMTADQKFIQEAAIGGLKEVEMGRLAQAHGESQAVKDFGRKLVEDHGKANDELKQIAQSKGIVLSEIAAAKKEKSTDAEMGQHLAKLSGAEFDKAFASHMVKDHDMDIKKFEHEAAKGTDAEVKAFAEKCLPTLREHLAMAKQLNSGNKNQASTDVNDAAGASARVRSSGTSTTK